MTIDRFFARLRSFKGKFEVEANGEIRTKGERATGFYGYKRLCPIEEMYRNDTKKRLFGSMATAEQGLQLTRATANAIMDAADDMPAATYRQRMLATLGLTELEP